MHALLHFPWGCGKGVFNYNTIQILLQLYLCSISLHLQKWHLNCTMQSSLTIIRILCSSLTRKCLCCKSAGSVPALKRTCSSLEGHTLKLVNVFVQIQGNEQDRQSTPSLHSWSCPDMVIDPLQNFTTCWPLVQSIFKVACTARKLEKYSRKYCHMPHVVHESP